MNRLEKWIFPPKCLITEQRLSLESPFDLASEIVQSFRHRQEVCPKCNEVTPQKQVCGACLTTPISLDATHTGFDFEDDLRDLILRFKYQPAMFLGKLLVELALPHFQNRGVEVLLPVPIHPERLRERGFNQATILAQYLGKSLNIPVVTQGLQRIKNTETQTHLSAKERHKNLKNAFAVDKEMLSGFKRVALIDDVITTGATTQVLASILKRDAAVEWVEAWAVAKTR